MEISVKSIKSFNAGIEASFNPQYNKLNGIQSLEEQALFRRVQNHKFGMFKKPITKKMVLEFLEWNPKEIEEIKVFYARFNY